MIFDAHIHAQPWEMVKPEVLAMIDDDSHANAKDVLSSPENLLRYLDAEGVDRACCINYVSPDVMGFTREVNDWIAKFTANHRDRLVPVGSVNPLHEMNVHDEIRRVLDLGIGLIKIHPPHQLFSPNAYRGELWQLAEIYRECEARGVPVMFHTGTRSFRARATCSPIRCRSTTWPSTSRGSTSSSRTPAVRCTARPRSFSRGATRT